MRSLSSRPPSRPQTLTADEVPRRALREADVGEREPRGGLRGAAMCTSPRDAPQPQFGVHQ